MKQQRTFEIISSSFGREQVVCQLSNTNLREARRFAREHSLYWKKNVVGVSELGTVLIRYTNGKTVSEAQS